MLVSFIILRGCIQPSPICNSCSSTMQAGRDLKFISMSMSGIFILGSVVLLVCKFPVSYLTFKGSLLHDLKVLI